MSFRMEKPGLDPEQIRRILAEQSRRQEPTEAAGSETGGGGDGPPTEATAERFEFDLKPEELIAHLDEYVVGQQRAKAILSTKICTHFNRLSLSVEDEEEVVGRIKNNTGCLFTFGRKREQTVFSWRSQVIRGSNQQFNR